MLPATRFQRVFQLISKTANQHIDYWPNLFVFVNNIDIKGNASH